MFEQPSTVVLAMSGGLDSSVAAALLKKAGWKVLGLHFLLPAAPSRARTRMEKVRSVADHLKIPLSIMDLRGVFERKVMEPFKDAYLNGLTPNPCVVCNGSVKFEYLLRYAEQHNVRCLASGHYVRLLRRGGLPVGLVRGRDGNKEQSYFLHRLGQTVLLRAGFPLGEMTKEEVRLKAREWDLPVSGDPESQEICFLCGKDYRAFIEPRMGAGPTPQGDIVNRSGQVLGRHGGAYRYTVGQRQGLGIASSRPYYVLETRPETNEVVVGRREELYSRTLEAEDFNWIDGFPHKGGRPVQAQVRYRHRAAAGLLEVISAKRVRFTFDDPQWAVTPGQALVCYEDDRVLGGGWITRDRKGQESEGPVPP